MIVVGASSGGLKALQTLFGGLPATFPLPVAVVLHRHKDSDETLLTALQRGCALPIIEAQDKTLIQDGCVYLAPADYHLLMEPTYFSLSTDDPVLYARPSIDVLFESAADIFGSKTIGVILTGSSRDGAQGCAQIQKRGGTVVVQDPATAECPVMPAAAQAATQTPHVLPVSEIAQTLINLAKKPTG